MPTDILFALSCLETVPYLSNFIFLIKQVSGTEVYVSDSILTEGTGIFPSLAWSGFRHDAVHAVVVKIKLYHPFVLHFLPQISTYTLLTMTEK